MDLLFVNSAIQSLRIVGSCSRCTAPPLLLVSFGVVNDLYCRALAKLTAAGF